MKKKKAQTRHRRAGSRVGASDATPRVGLWCSILPAASVLQRWGYWDTLLLFIFSFEKISKLYPKLKKCIYSIIYEYFLFSAIPRLGNGSSWADLEFRWNLNNNLGMTILVNLSPLLALFLKSEPSFNHSKTATVNTSYSFVSHWGSCKSVTSPVNFNILSTTV